jgi:hypothetical protein
VPGIATLELDLLLARPPRALDDLSPERRRALLDAAHRHGALQAISGRLPDGDALLRARFHALAALARARDAALRKGLDAALTALKARGISPCALKGPVLADRVYPEPALRVGTDLDLLVEEEQLDAGILALERDGYRRVEGFRARYERACGHHVKLVHPERPVVELHFKPRSGTRSALRADDVLSRARPFTTPSGALVRVLAPEDELVYLALHAAHHSIEREGWVLDLLLLLDAHPDLDWTIAAERARAARCRRAVAFVSRHLDALGADIPDFVLEPMTARRARMAMRLRRIVQPRAKTNRVAQGARLAFEALMCDDLLLAAGHVSHEVHWFVRRNTHRALQRLRRPS